MMKKRDNEIWKELCNTAEQINYILKEIIKIKKEIIEIKDNN